MSGGAREKRQPNFPSKKGKTVPEQNGSTAGKTPQRMNSPARLSNPARGRSDRRKGTGKGRRLEPAANAPAVKRAGGRADFWPSELSGVAVSKAKPRSSGPTSFQKRDTKPSRGVQADPAAV